MTHIPIVIPSFNPDDRLITLIKQLHSSKNGSKQKIIIVNDGSSKKYDDIFEYIQKNFQVTILKHPINFGKGRAIKTAINYVFKGIPEAIGLITIDSDGQHSVTDMIKCTDTFLTKPKDLILGTRAFDHEVPLRSKFGNIVTAKFMQITTGIKISDTQTGLRVIPKMYFKALINMKGDRFEFEMNMILEAANYDINIVEVPIKTIYLNDNKSSHFRIIHDSLSIYGVFFKYIFGAISSFVVDILIFMFMIGVLNKLSVSAAIVIASIVSRVTSSVFNYYINRKIVFKNNNRLSLISYYTLVLTQMLLSTGLVIISNQYVTHVNITMLKVIIDAGLFFVSYQVQKHVVFKGPR